MDREEIELDFFTCLERMTKNSHIYILSIPKYRMFSKKEKEWLLQMASGDVNREEFSYNYEQKLMKRIKVKVNKTRKELEWYASLDIELNHRS